MTKSIDGKYLDKEGNPTFKIAADGTVDWFTYSGFRHYHSECHVCHGPYGEGSSYAPALKDSVKQMSYGEFLNVVASGRKNVVVVEENVMPAFGAQSERRLPSRRPLHLSARPRRRRAGAGAAGQARGQAGGRQAGRSLLHGQQGLSRRGALLGACAQPTETMPMIKLAIERATMLRAERRHVAALGVALALAMLGAGVAQAQMQPPLPNQDVADPTIELIDPKVMRVCADPRNLPFSNEKGEGVENKLAELFAAKLNKKLDYVYFPQATGFVRMTLAAHRCDIIMGFPQGDDLVQNTNPYYRSAYALVAKPGSDLDGVRIARRSRG